MNNILWVAAATVTLPLHLAFAAEQFPSHGPCGLPIPTKTEKCTPEIEATVAVLHSKWGDFRHECKGGKVVLMEFAASGPLSQGWTDFVLENARIFGARSSDLHRIKDPYNNGFDQTFHGANGPGYVRASNRNGEGEICSLTAHTTDTSKWTVDAIPKISSQTAQKTAMKIWDKTFGAGVAKIDFVWLEVSDKPTEHPLVWVILGSAPGKLLGLDWDAYTRIACNIDARDGTPVFDCEGSGVPKDPVLKIKPGTKLRFSAKLEKETYAVGDEIRVLVELENDSRETVRALTPRTYGCAEDSRSTVKLEIRGSDSKRVLRQHCTYMNNIFEAGGFSGALGRTTLLRPGESKSEPIRIQPKAKKSEEQFFLGCELSDWDDRQSPRYHQLPAGNYTLTLRYDAASNRDYFWDQKVQSKYGDLWKGILTSPELKLVIQ